MTAGEWELTQSRMFPVLDHYQKEGYQALMKISRQHRGAFLCDGVGLGKTFIGLMAIERLTQYEKKNVVLFVPKAARAPVWEAKIRKYLPELFGGDFSRLVVFNHTDLGRGGEFPERLTNLKLKADVVVIDEAHHFRNLGQKDKSRYWHMADFCAGKTVLLLTATPINNSLLDLRHMIELFTGREPAYFKAAPLGIHSLPGHFRKMEKALEKLLGHRPRMRAPPRSNLSEAERSSPATSSSVRSSSSEAAPTSRRARKQSRRSQGAFPQAGSPEGRAVLDQEDLRAAARHGREGVCQEEAPVLAADVLPVGLLQGPRQEHRPDGSRTARSRWSA